MSALWGRALLSIKTKVGPTAAAYHRTMGFRTLSRYRTVVTEPRLKMCRSVRYPNEILADTLPASECVMFGDILRLIACSLFTPYPYTLVIWLQRKS
ncbi:hypothetical protein TNCV_839521 [Trichonephila clavipes]|nr:hypothetical protein TNCV_839521 [Trichonephila clavipes]